MVDHDHHHATELGNDDTATRWSALMVMLFVCALMFLGAFLAGQYGNGLRRSKKALAMLNVFGSGLLLGTALGIIIPEGARALNEKSAVGAGHSHEGSAHAHAVGGGGEHEEETGFFSSESLLGWTLVLGFLTMMMADHTQCLSGSTSSTTNNNAVDAAAASAVDHHNHGHSHFGSLETEGMSEGNNSKNDLERNKEEGGGEMVNDNNNASASPPLPDAIERDEDKQHRHHHQQTTKRRSTVTLGLLIHNAFDGLAMGAAKAASSQWNSTQTIVFWAIMMHHVPAAFGFATFLRSTGHEEFRVQRDLLWFSGAGPAAALLTFVLLHDGFLGMFDLTGRAVGCCLLFSGGTFLYVATVHAFDEAKRAFPNHVLGPKELSLVCAGALLPLVLSSTAGHGH